MGGDENLLDGEEEVDLVGLPALPDGAEDDDEDGGEYAGPPAPVSHAAQPPGEGGRPAGGAGADSGGVGQGVVAPQPEDVREEGGVEAGASLPTVIISEPCYPDSIVEP